MWKYCGSIFQLGFFIFYIIFLPSISFSSTFHFFFSFFFFLFFSSTQDTQPPFFLFSFSPQEHSSASHQRREIERERERERSAWASTTCISTAVPAATLASPPPLIILPTNRLGSDRLVLFFFFFFFFSFFFSYLLVLIQLYFKNWILFFVLCLDYVRNGVRLACSFFLLSFFHICLFWFNFILRIRYCFVFGLCEKRREWEKKKNLEERERIDIIVAGIIF